MGTESQQRPPSGREPTFAEKRRGDFWINAFIGAAVTFVVSMLPVVQTLAPIVGGGASGYLQNTGRGDGIKVGAVAGLVASIPVVFVLFIFFVFFGGIFGLSSGTSEGLAFGSLFAGLGFLMVVFVVLLNTVLSAAGGWIGTAVAED